MFRDPIFTDAGNTYERAAIVELWQRREEFYDPLFNTVSAKGGLRTNWDKRREVQEFLTERPAYIPNGWDSREVPSASTITDQLKAQQRHGGDSSWMGLRLAWCPKRRWVRILAMIMASLAAVIGSLSVQLTCLGSLSDEAPCAGLIAVSDMYSPWIVAPVTVVLGGCLFGALVGSITAIVVMCYVCAVWLTRLIPEIRRAIVGSAQPRNSTLPNHIGAAARNAAQPNQT